MHRITRPGSALKVVAFAGLVFISSAAASVANPIPQMTPFPAARDHVLVRGPYCKDHRTCTAAVRAWCNGTHPGADRDNDKIPCENICKSRAQVRKIARKLGCAKGS